MSLTFVTTLKGYSLYSGKLVGLIIIYPCTPRYLTAVPPSEAVTLACLAEVLCRSHLRRLPSPSKWENSVRWLTQTPAYISSSELPNWCDDSDGGTDHWSIFFMQSSQLINSMYFSNFITFWNEFRSLSFIAMANN